MVILRELGGCSFTGFTCSLTTLGGANWTWEETDSRVAEKERFRCSVNKKQNLSWRHF